MQKKTCPNGHVYDPSIYGDQCPLCPPGANPTPSFYDDAPATQLGYGAPMGAAPTPPPPAGMKTQIGGAAPMQAVPVGNGAAGPTGPTMAGPAPSRKPMAAQQSADEGHTVIRHFGASKAGGRDVPSRKLVGFLVTYSQDPNGKAYNIYEGRNYIGRDASCDISIADKQMSGKHMSILYRNVDDKFKFRDEQSSNGTFVNKELQDDGELQNYDVIRVGNTNFIFIAIPNLG